jgi:hypothetical protein
LLDLQADRHSGRRARVMLQMTDGVSHQPCNMAEIGAQKGCLLPMGDEDEAALAGATILAAPEADHALAVDPEQVVAGQIEATDGRF